VKPPRLSGEASLQGFIRPQSPHGAGRTANTPQWGGWATLLVAQETIRCRIGNFGVMHCSDCGTWLDPGLDFCPTCGKPESEMVDSEDRR